MLSVKCYPMLLQNVAYLISSIVITIYTVRLKIYFETQVFNEQNDLPTTFLRVFFDLTVSSDDILYPMRYNSYIFR